MIKPPSDSDRRSSVGQRSSSTSSWLNCAGLTLLVLSLVLAVAALWIPWQRFGQMETDIQQMEERYQHLMEILNNTRQEISYKESLMNSPELVKSLDSASSESDETLKATWKKIFKNEKNLQKVLSSQKELEEKLQKQIQALERQKELRDGDKLETRKILDDIKNVMLNSNKLELSVERSQQGLVQITAMQEETANNLTRMADRLDTLEVNTDQVEENLKNMMLSHQEAQLANEREWRTKF